MTCQLEYILSANESFFLGSLRYGFRHYAATPTHHGVRAGEASTETHRAPGDEGCCTHQIQGLREPPPLPPMIPTVASTRRRGPVALTAPPKIFAPLSSADPGPEALTPPPQINLPCCLQQIQRSRKPQPLLPPTKLICPQLPPTDIGAAASPEPFEPPCSRGRVPRFLKS